MQAQNTAVAGTEDALLPPSALAVAWQQAGCLLNSPSMPDVYQVDLHARCVNNLGTNINTYALGPNNRKFRDLFNTLRTGSFKLFKRPFPGVLTILTL